MDDFKTRLRFYMRRDGFNPTSLAKNAHLNEKAVRDILAHAGSPKPRIDTFAKLCHTLKVTPYQLSPDFEKLCSPRQKRLLDKINKLDERDRQLLKEAAKAKDLKRP